MAGPEDDRREAAAAAIARQERMRAAKKEPSFKMSFDLEGDPPKPPPPPGAQLAGGEEGRREVDMGYTGKYDKYKGIISRTLKPKLLKEKEIPPGASYGEKRRIEAYNEDIRVRNAELLQQWEEEVEKSKPKPDPRKLLT